MTQQSNRSKVTIDLAGLEKIRKELGDQYFTKVGVLGGQKNTRNEGDGLTNAELAVIQEFGSNTNNIPPRSFLRMPLELKSKEIVQFLGSKTVMKAILAGDIQKAFAALGIVAEGFIQQAFSTSGFGQWQPLKDSTVKAKGSSKPLIDTGQLRRSITSKVETNKK